MELKLISCIGNFMRYLVIIVLCLTPIVNTGAIPSNQNLLNQSMPFQIIPDEISYMGGVKSIRALIGTSKIGILYRNAENPQPIRLFAEFTQRIAKIERLNRRGVVDEELELNTTNFALFQLDNLVEFADSDGNSWYDHRRTDRLLRSVNISDIVFSVRKLHEKVNDTALRYKVIFLAQNVSYSRSLGDLPSSSSKIEQLAFSFELTVKREIIDQVKIPTIQISPQGQRLTITTKNDLLGFSALRLTPRLKFSMNISGWDFDSPSSKLALKITTFAREQFQITKPKVQISLSRDVLKMTNLLGRLKFVTTERGDSLNQSHSLDHDQSQRTEYPSHRFVNSRFSFGSTNRDFLNFTWAPTVSVDSKDYPVYFQPSFSGERNLLVNPNPPYNPVSTLYLNGAFVFPQGNQIYYDPEVQIEELNPLGLSILPVPNRSLLQSTSLLILVSGFLLGVVVIIRQRTKNP